MRRWVVGLRSVIRRPAEAPRWWQELGIVGVGCYAYSRVQSALPAHPVGATARGTSLWRAEGRWHLRAEPALNAQLVAHHTLAVLADYYYVVFHFGVTLVILLWLYRWHARDYRRARRVLLVASALALLVFWQAPVAPPRLLSLTGLVDTVAQYHTWGGYESGALKAHADLLASMPSLHVAWALWCGIMLARFARSPIVRILGACYPLATALDVLGTANHYTFDVAGGLAILLLGAGVERLLAGDAVAAAASVLRRHPVRLPPRHRRPALTLRELATPSVHARQERSVHDHLVHQ